MNELFAIQEKFQAYLLDNNNHEIVKWVISTPSVSAERRLNFYAYAYKARLLEALATNFSVVKLFLGDEEFEKLGYAYIKAYPSHYRSIRWFGDKLVGFIQNNPVYQNYPYLVELAKIEWALTTTFDSPDSAVLSVAELAAIPPENWMSLRFIPHPSLQRINLSWNVMSIWQALSNEEAKVPAPQESAEPVPWIFWRKELLNQFCSLPENEAWAIDAMLKASTFEQICEGLCQWVNEEEVAMHAASLLKGWILAELISGVEI
jgi:hypothetical protein